jgi:hypothetical protein
MGACVWSAQAHPTEEILALTVTNVTSFVIAADGLNDAQNSGPGYDRDAIRVRAQVRYSTTNATTSSFQYELRFRLLNLAGQPVPLLQTNGTTNATFTLNETVGLPFLGISTVTRTHFPALKPATRLDPYDRYRVELSLHERPAGSANPFVPTGDTALDVTHLYFHFTNTNNNDVELNVIARLDSAVFTRAYAVGTIPGKKSFQATVGYSLTRYDRFLSAINNSNVVVRLDYQLVDAATGSPVPLVQAHILMTNLVPSYVSGTPKTPVTVNFPAVLDLEPAAQLDSVDRLYRAEVTISHFEVLGQPADPGNTFSTPNQRLLHFDGTLRFGNVETRFTSIDNTPAPGMVVASSHVASTLGVDNNSGFLVGFPSHRYGNGADLPVNLLINGDAIFTGGSVNVTQPVPDNGTNAYVRFQRTGLVLDTQGARSTVTVTLPTGFGYRLNPDGRVLQSKLSWPNVRLTPQLAPANNLTYATMHYACEETKPFLIQSSAMTWEIEAGRFVLAPMGQLIYVRAKELADLEAAPGLVTAEMRIKRSNEQYFRSLDVATTPVSVQAASDFSARMSVEVQFQPGSFITHFPYDSQVSWLQGGGMRIVNDLALATNSTLAGVNTITNRYDQDCPGCGPGKGRTNLNLVVNGGALNFTTDGGLVGAGDLAAARPLNWGWIAEPSIQKFAQRTTPFSKANFLMSGCFLRGDQTGLDKNDRAGVLLLTGVAATNLTYLERPGMNEYFAGRADYAGMNFAVGTSGAIEAESVLAGVASGLYDLTGRSKYYTRWSGVSGIHEAVYGSFPTNLTLYGYDMTFTNYGLSYLSSQNEDSTTEGTVHVRPPSNFDQNFKELMFSCVGALLGAKVPGGEKNLYKLLEYWNGDFVTEAINFDRKDGLECNPGVGYLVLGLKAHATYVKDPLFGSVGFKNTGRIITAQDAGTGEILLDDGFDSRLKLPNNFTIAGPTTNENYTLIPVSDAYYNDFDSRVAADQGYVNIAAEMDVPFFENMKVHLHTSAKTNSPYAPIHVMGGWPTYGFELGGTNFFNVPHFDADNTGFPIAAQDEARYRNSPTEAYHPRAQSWIVEVSRRSMKCSAPISTTFSTTRSSTSCSSR